MAEILDARVKQKTGVAADFAGYTLLEGEIALVRTSASGPVWNFKVGPGNFDSLDWSLALSGAAQEANTSTVFPSGVPGLYIPTEDGTYDGVTVDLSVGYVQLIWDGSTMTKVEFPINLSGYLQTSEISKTAIGFKENLADPDTFVLNSRVVIADGTIIGDGSGNYVRTPFISIDGNKDVVMTRGVNTAQSIAFYSSANTGDWIASISGGPARTTTITPPPGTTHMMTNPSTQSTTREADIAAFGIYQDGESVIDTIEEVGLLAKGLSNKTNIITKPSIQYRDKSTSNLYSVGQVEDDTYVFSSGAVGIGASNPASNFAMARIPIDRNRGGEVSWRRSSTSGTMGYFFDANHRPISGITGVGSAETGTNEIPPGAEWLYVNVSNNPLSRALDKSRLTVVYGNTVPEDHIPQPSLIGVASLLVSHPHSGKKFIAIGDSITTYERVGVDGQNPQSNYFVRACADMGALMLENYSIGGSTISQRAADPTGRNPISIRYTDMRDDADFVIVSAGTNDCTHAWTPLGTFADSTVNTFYGAMHVLCQGLKAKYIGKYIVFLTPIRRYHAPAGMTTPTSPNANGETPQQYVDAIIEVCNYYGIPVLDNYRTCILNPFIEEYRNEYMSDGTHPNAAGHIIMKDRLVNFLRQL